jgi:2-oxoglutarate ferredoxin oxidoreductase subunit alpha
VVDGGGIIVDKAQYATEVMSIPTLPPGFRNELREYMDQKAVGETLGDFLGYAQKNSIQVFPVPYMDLLKQVASELGVDQISKVTRMTNVLTIGVTFALLDYDPNLVEQAVSAIFSDKPKVAEMNLLAVRESRDYAKKTFADSFRHRLTKVGLSEERIFVSGNQAVAMGKVLGGCRVQTYYPITPAADESEYLESHEILKTKSGNGAIIVVQTEDEIAAVNSASGAALTGARAATSTSGPGFALMVEGLSWAGNCEVPLVITYYQRGAPATGLPTRHGQADLRFALHAGHGEFPRIVLASGDIRECFYDAAKAFNYAEKYQLPVIHLIDKALANSSQTYPVFQTSQFKIDRGEILDEQSLLDQAYKRFSLTETGVSPRVLLGTKNGVHWYTGDEHDEYGHINEEPSNRTLMMEKRMKKLELVDKETPLEEKVNFYGDKNAEYLVMSWGSPKGAIIEAMNALASEGFSLGFMQFRMIHPLPTGYISQSLNAAKKVIDVEGNYLGQLAGVIKEQTGVSADYYLLKYTGRPMSTTEVYAGLENILRGRAPVRQVLTYGS